MLQYKRRTEMNEKLRTLLDYCEPQEIRPGFWEGNFTANRKQTSDLYKLRDGLTDQDWLDIAVAAQAGYPLLPNNLRHSLEVKFHEFEEFIGQDKLERKTIPEILKTANSWEYEQTQKMIWGVLVSCVECAWFYEKENTESDSLFEGL